MNPCILVVDDDSAIAETLALYLRRAGFRVRSAGSAEQALALMAEEPAELVVTDISLPGENGLELTKAVRQLHGANVIAMTGHSGLYSYAEAVGHGASDFLLKPVNFEELLLRVKRVLRERELSSERDRMVEELQHLATTDALTQLKNTRHFFEQLTLEAERAARYRRPLSLVLLDIDHFKRFNDQWGHIEGDRVLARLGQVILSGLRTMDSGYRYGGEEFTLLLPETAAGEAGKVAERLRGALAAESFRPEGAEEAVQVTISAGAAQYRASEPLDVFVARADRAMYRAKHDGRNRVVVFGDGD
jgi:diguanylate cyclase (GGDEF)-like protein